MARGRDRRNLPARCACQSKSTEFASFGNRQGALPLAFPLSVCRRAVRVRARGASSLFCPQAQVCHSLDQAVAYFPRPGSAGSCCSQSSAVTSSAVISKVIRTPVHTQACFCRMSIKKSLGHVKGVIVIVTAKFPPAWHQAWVFARCCASSVLVCIFLMTELSNLFHVCYKFLNFFLQALYILFPCFPCWSFSFLTSMTVFKHE